MSCRGDRTASQGARARVADYPDLSFEYLREWKYNHMVNLDYPGLQLVYKGQVRHIVCCGVV